MTLLSLILFLSVSAFADTFDPNAIADAIYKAEGAAKTKFPYGIKSINTHGDKDYARKICLNSIRNARKRWIEAGKPEDFISFLASRYCPVSAHKLNKNWVRLVKYFINKESKK